MLKKMVLVNILVGFISLNRTSIKNVSTQDFIESLKSIQNNVQEIKSNVAIYKPKTISLSLNVKNGDYNKNKLTQLMNVYSCKSELSNRTVTNNKIRNKEYIKNVNYVKENGIEKESGFDLSLLREESNYNFNSCYIKDEIYLNYDYYIKEVLELKEIKVNDRIVKLPSYEVTSSNGSIVMKENEIYSTDKITINFKYLK